MRRREFIVGLGSTATVGPLAARAQQPDRGRWIGVLVGLIEDDPDTKLWLAVFRQRLEGLGWSPGRNIHIDLRFAASAQVRALAKELITLQPDAILAQTTPETLLATANEVIQ
jgi:putative ABC transport system substrate-binding protein